MDYRALGRTGVEVSVMGFGAAPLGNVYGVLGVADGERAVARAIDLGINFFDTSPYYGLTLSEERLGKALAGRRQRVVLATKCGRYGAAEFDFSAERVTRSVDESLARLQTDYVDLLQVHDCEFGDRLQVVEETLPALEVLRQQGKTRLIGITGYQVENLEWIARAALAAGIKLDTILNYCRYDLANTTMESLAAFAAEAGIGLVNASPLHMGLLTEDGPPPWHPAPAAARVAARHAIEVCKAKGASIEAVGLRFCLDYPGVASTFVGMGTAELVDRNVAVLGSKTDAALVEELREMLRHEGAGVIWPSGLRENWDAGTVRDGL